MNVSLKGAVQLVGSEFEWQLRAECVDLRLHTRGADRGHLVAPDFCAETLPVFSACLERGQEVERLFEPAGVLPLCVLAVGNAPFVCALVASNAGLGILGKWAAARAVKSYGLKTVKLTPVGLRSNWYAACVKGRGLDKAISALLLMLKWSLA